MKLFFRELTRDHAIEILNWRYPSPYELYNQEESEAEIEEYLNQPHKAVVDQEDQLIGYYCIGQSAQVPKGHEFNVYEMDCLDIGVGMKPELTGQGFGREFMGFILQELPVDSLRLTVAKFNKRAIKLYEGFGFKQVDAFSNGEVDFITMIKE